MITRRKIEIAKLQQRETSLDVERRELAERLDEVLRYFSNIFLS